MRVFDVNGDLKEEMAQVEEFLRQWQTPLYLSGGKPVYLTQTPEYAKAVENLSRRDLPDPAGSVWLS